MEQMVKGSVQKAWTRLDIIVGSVAVAMVLYHLVSTQYLLVCYLEHQNIHLVFSLVLVFLVSASKMSKMRWSVLFLFIIFSLAATGYIQFYFDDLNDRLSFPVFADVIVGTVLIVLVLEATRRAFGITLVIVALLFMLYMYFGFLLPASLGGIKYSFGKYISKLAVLQGIYGTILGISADYLFLFVAFGSVLQVSGATRFFMQIGRLLGRTGVSGGPALTAVISSALLGTLTGSVAANVVTSGSYTIPLMKSAGYKPEQAAGIEAAASTGGQIMPPIMGAGAFLMAGIIGVPYSKVMVVAFIPAVLYFFVVGIYAQLQAMKLGIKPLPEDFDIREMLSTSYLFVVPIGVVVYLLAVDYTPTFVIFWAIVSVIVLSMLRKETRPSFMQWVEGFRSGAILGAQIAVSCAVIGLIVSCISLSGLGLKLPGIVATISSGNLAVTLLLTSVVALLLGCGMPTVAVYVLVVVVIAPAIINMGIPVLTAHLFVFYLACMNFVTLPVAVGALIASKVAGASYAKTGIESMKAAFGGFMVPFVFILVPALLLEGNESVSTLCVVSQVASAVVALVAFEVCFVNYFLCTMHAAERVGMAVSAFMSYGFLVSGNNIFAAVGYALFVMVSVWQIRKRKRMVLMTSGAT